MGYITTYAGTDGANQILINVPNFEGVTEYDYASSGRPSTNLTTLLNFIPEYAYEATFIVFSTTIKNKAVEFGLINTYSIEELNGVTWSFPNGTAINFRKINANFGYIDYYVNDTFIYSDTVNNPSDAPLRSLFSDKLYNGRNGNAYYVITGTLNQGGTLKTYRYPGTDASSQSRNYWENLTPYVEPTDPYADGGTSTTGGGTGTFDGTTAAVDFPAGTPTASAGASGFIKLFNPTAANLSALAAYLWGTFDISSFKSIYNNPIDCIVALTVVPVQPTTGAAATISLGNVASDVTAPIITNQFVIFDCGSIDINEFWGAYLDYDPYTKCEIYLPYIGVQDIDINDIQGKTIQLKYYIDVLSGACVAMLKCADDVLYNWSGQCGAEVPITSTSFGSAFQTALSVGNAIGETIVNAMSGIPQSLSLVASSVFNGARSKVHKSGSIGSMAGHMGIQKPYLIITRPVQSVPENLNEITGYPSNITATLGDLSGYTEVDTIHLAGIPATSEEMAEIEELLKDGVFI